MMRRSSEARVDLDSPVRAPIPDFAVATNQPALIFVRQLQPYRRLGWSQWAAGDFGRGDDAVALYVKAMAPAAAHLREPRSRPCQVLWLRAASSSLSPEQPTNLVPEAVA